MNPNKLAARIAAHKHSGQGGIVSVCSAHPEVIMAAARLAQRYGAPLLIESTSNQVDQFGGYTGMTPQDFMLYVRALLGGDAPPVIFGGDHLGPNVWQKLPAEEAMTHAEELIRAYAQAGYDKIHLDCSMSCADDPVPLDDETVARRAARLCRIAEDVRHADGGTPIVYIIGTEVPVPGGAQEALDGITPTTPDAARTTYDIHRRIFAEHGLGNHVWNRVIGLVVQPGVEFDHHRVEDYLPEKARQLSQVADEFPHAVFEAHSTDYQNPQAFKDLVRDHFAILKVGPALTFAYREALYALNRAARAMGLAAPDVEAIAENVMLDKPQHWQKYYHGDAAEQHLLRHYSLSDRIRYYWPEGTIAESVAKLREAFDAAEIPLGLMHQYLPGAVETCRAQGQALNSVNLIRAHIQTALIPYYEACKTENDQKQ